MDFRNRIMGVSATKLWLVRDRIGVKPLYYSLHDGQIAFASEIKALLEDPRQERALDEESLYHYLSFLTTPAPRTLFEVFASWPPGTWIRVDDRGLSRSGVIGMSGTMPARSTPTANRKLRSVYSRNCGRPFS